jgi:hypothetical protein
MIPTPKSTDSIIAVDDAEKSGGNPCAATQKSLSLCANDVLALDTCMTGRYRGPFEPSCRLMRGLASGAIIVIFVGMVTSAVAADAALRKVLTLSIVNGAVVGVGDTVKVQQGDDLELRWSSDKPMELHLHGYDIEVKVSPQAPAVMSFKANIPRSLPSGATRPRAGTPSPGSLSRGTSIVCTG